MIMHNFYIRHKNRDRLNWLQAVCTADPLLIRDTRLKILDRRCATHSRLYWIPPAALGPRLSSPPSLLLLQVPIRSTGVHLQRAGGKAIRTYVIHGKEEKERGHDEARRGRPHALRCSICYV